MQIRLGRKYRHLTSQVGCACCRVEVQELAGRVDMGVTRRGLLAGMAASAASLWLPDAALAQAVPAPAAEAAPILFTNLRLFDGKGGALRSGINVLVEGNKITSVMGGTQPSLAEERVIDCGGRTLMPGLIDAHAHLTFETISLANALNADIGYLYAAAVRAAAQQVMHGFTTIRDTGGNTFGLKRAFDTGVAIGPRIYPSGAMISQTGGHGDFGGYNDVPREVAAPLSPAERSNFTIIADGADAVLTRSREQLRRGASQLKLAAGGGVASDFDPLDSVQYTDAEFRAGVQAAENWGTYVTVHVYTPRAIKVAIGAGVKCIEHGHLADDETARQIADKGVWWSLQPFLGYSDAIHFPEGSANRVKLLQVVQGTDTAYALAKKHDIKTAFGTDTLFDAKLAARRGAQLASLVRWYDPADVLKMATSDNAALLAMSGPRNPYPGKLGAVEEGALADLLVVDGDPIANIKLIEDPDKNFKLIMKDGRIYKNNL
jgi:imidazolonepropionase-like amidohydrolase